MDSQIGIVNILIGTATATADDGTVRHLQHGDKIYSGELLSTGSEGAIEIEFADGSVMDLGRNSQMVLDDAVYQSDPIVEADVIQQATLTDVDLPGVTELTSVGEDVLDISDLLVGEESSVDLTAYLYVTEDGSNTVIEINADGGADATKTITLQNTSFADIGAGGLTDQADIINALIAHNHIVVD